jgi:hypothetical protein
MFDSNAPRFGLATGLWIPIAAASIADIETYVGAIRQRITDPATGRVNALAVTPPFLRLCPVHRQVNTNAGHASGGEGMERRFLAAHPPAPGQNRIIYADPFDLTKMLDLSPGTQVLSGVRDTQRLFY